MKKYALIVDDDKFARLIHANLLVNTEYTILEAENGKEAVHQFLTYQEKLDIILMDFNMPEMNGADATREIRSIERVSKSRPLCIIGITANANSDVRASCFDAGMDDVINKPVVASQLSKYFKRVI